MSLERNITTGVLQRETKYADRSRSKDRVALSAANHFDTSDPLWLSTWDRESRKLARWSILALQSTETLTGRCASDINCTSGPSWQSSIDFKERNLGFRSCKDQQVACNNPQRGPVGSLQHHPRDYSSGPRWRRCESASCKRQLHLWGGTWGFTSARTRCGSLHIAKEWNK